MSKIKSVRLPDSVIQMADDYCKVNGIGFTDLVVAGINNILYPEKLQSNDNVAKNDVGKDEPRPAKSVVGASGSAGFSQDKHVIRNTDDIQPVLQAVKRPDYIRPAHHPSCVCGMCRPPKALI